MLLKRGIPAEDEELAFVCVYMVASESESMAPGGLEAMYVKACSRIRSHYRKISQTQSLQSSHAHSYTNSTTLTSSSNHDKQSISIKRAMEKEDEDDGD